MSTTGMCFICGRLILDGVGRFTPGVALDYHGTKVRAHKQCAKGYEAEQRGESITARARDEPRERTGAGDGY